MTEKRAPVRRIVPAVAAATVLITITACSTSSGHGSGSSAAGSSSAGSSAVAAPGTATASPGSSPAASPATSPAASGTQQAPKKDVISGLIAFRGQVKFSGAQNVSMSFSAFPGVTSPKSSCGHIGATGTPTAQGRTALFSIPSPPQGGNLTIQAEVTPYHGPGKYQKASLVSAGPSVVVGNDSYNLRATGASVAITFNANGSGDLSFTGATAAQTGRPSLSGEIQWTCAVQ